MELDENNALQDIYLISNSDLSLETWSKKITFVL